MSEKVLEVRKINKSFFKTQVLFDVDLDVRPGEVHVLLGENGAGKSTLMKILSGVHPADSGEIWVSGAPARIKSPQDSLQHGIGMVYQELSLAPNLDVVENVFLGALPNHMGFVDWESAAERTREIFKELGIELDVRRRVSSFDLGIQQLVEIMRVLSQNARLIILDEPTSSLTNAEVEKLFHSIRLLRERGISFIYITHKLDEVFQIGDRITVLRDGHKIGETIEDLSGITQEDLVSMVVGRKLENRYPKQPAYRDDPLMQVDGLSDGKAFFDISFTLHKGEVLGISGLVGAGSSELMDALFGLRKITAGSVRVHGKPFQPKDAAHSIRHRLGLLTKDRGDSVFAHLALSDNIVVSNPRAFSKLGFRLKRKELHTAAEYIDKLSIATDSVHKKVRNLSGGNQQKVSIAKWLCCGTEIYLMDDPTRGIDVGSKVEVYNLINQLTADGAGILLASSDMPELLGISDNIMVMRKGRITAYRKAVGTTQEYILEKAAGGE